VFVSLEFALPHFVAWGVFHCAWRPVNNLQITGGWHYLFAPLATPQGWGIVITIKSIYIRRNKSMAKIKLNPIVEEVSGGLGNLVFRTSNGKTVLCRKPDFSDNEITEDQAAHRERFRQAVAYGRSVMANEDMREIYNQAAERKGIPVFALTVADFFNAPSINEVNLSAYNGKIGDMIKVSALDDVNVMSVHVALVNSQDNALIESGDAVETAAGSGQWVYTATTAVPAGTLVNFTVVVTDRPGGTAIETQSKSV
jgi:hypothetical protein